MQNVPAFTELEALLLPQGFFLAAQISEVLFASGLIFLPLLAGVVRITKAAREHRKEDHISGNMLSYMLFSVVLMVFSMLPLFAVSADKVTVNDGCQNGQGRHFYSSYRIAQNLRSASPATELGEQADSVTSSLWWILWNKLAGGIGNTLIHKIPCYTDHYFIYSLVSMRTITSPQLRVEYRNFYYDCYTRAYKNYLHTVIEGSEKEQLGYVGNPFFLTTPGFYRKCSRIAQSGQSPCHNGSDPGPAQGVERWQGKRYPSCEEWWLGDGDNTGLRDLLYQEALDDSQFCGALPQSLQHYIGEEHKDELVRNITRTTYFNTRDYLTHSVAFSPSYYSAIADYLDSHFGYTRPVLARPYLFKQAINSAQPVVLTVLIIFFPIFFWLAGYSLQALFFYTGLVLAVKVAPALLIINSYLFNLLFPAQVAAWFAISPIQQSLLAWIGSWFPVISNVVLIALLAWAGFASGKAAEWERVGRSAD